MTESVVAVAFYETVDGKQKSHELSHGETFELDCDLATHVTVEARPAEDEKIEADGGREIPDGGRQFYESREAREKVIDRLDRARNCWPMLKAMQGEKEWSNLSIVDYIRPMKMTRGSVALHSAEAKGDGYYSVNSERVLVHIQDGPLGITRSAGKEARMMLQTAILTETVRPVLPENTPFIEDE